MNLSHEQCPRCSTEPIPETEPGYTVVARFSNAAEAGFFADELAQRLVSEPRLVQRDHLDPFTHAWKATFELSVEDSEARLAVSFLKEIVASTGGETSPASYRPSFDSPDRPAEDSGINWVPIILTLTAGSFVIWASGRPAEGPGHRVSAEDLLKTLGSHPEPWIQRGPTGRDVRQLTVDPRRREIIIRQDLDGDGQFEIEDVVLEAN